MPERKIIEVAPDKKIIPVPKEDVRAIAFCRWQDMGDGTFRPVFEIRERKLRLTEAERVLNVPYRTLQRLVRGGFISGEQITPGFWQIDLLSYFDHVERVRKDPEFWQHENNRTTYRDAL